jgi:5,10-methylenetetrahydrofolate reductase
VAAYPEMDPQETSFEDDLKKLRAQIKSRRRSHKGFRHSSESILKFDEEIVSNLSRELLKQGVPRTHFHTMNQIEANFAIWKNIK